MCVLLIARFFSEINVNSVQLPVLHFLLPHVEISASDWVKMAGGPSLLKSVYLSIYNWVVFIGWYTLRLQQTTFLYSSMQSTFSDSVFWILLQVPGLDSRRQDTQGSRAPACLRRRRKAPPARPDRRRLGGKIPTFHNSYTDRALSDWCFFLFSMFSRNVKQILHGLVGKLFW